MALAATSLIISGTGSPGATSQATASISPTNGRMYIVWVMSTRGSSLDPDTVTMSGNGQTWTSLTDSLWVNSGTVRRRHQLFWCQGVGVSSGAITFSYTNQPDTMDWNVLEITGQHQGGYVTSNVKTSTVGASFTQGNLIETTTMNAAGSSSNRYLSFIVNNVNNTTRGELSSDTNGDANWTVLGQRNSSTTRTRSMCSFWLDAAPSTDTTPGFMSTPTNGNYGQFSLELRASTTGISTVSGVAYASLATVSGVAITSASTVLGVA